MRVIKEIKRNKNNSGITLVALVVTIILVIVIAGVAISLITGENGLFTKANQAATIYDKESQTEKAKFDSMMNVLNEYGENSENAGNGGNPIVAIDPVFEYQYGGLATKDEINTDMFLYTVLTEQSGSQHGTVKITGMNWQYFFADYYDDEEGEYNITNLNKIAQQISKIVIPYEVTINGKTYNVTEFEKLYLPDENVYGETWRIRDDSNNDTSLAAGSSADGTTVLKFSYLIIPSSITKITGSWSPDPIPRDYVLFSPNSELTEIDEFAFSGNNCFESIVIPNGCTKIGDCAFDNCSMLGKIYIPKSVTEIGGSAFNHGGTPYWFIPPIENIVVYYEGTQTEWNSITMQSWSFNVDETILYNQTVSDMQ